MRHTENDSSKIGEVSRDIQLARAGAPNYSVKTSTFTRVDKFDHMSRKRINSGDLVARQQNRKYWMQKFDEDMSESEVEVQDYLRRRLIHVDPETLLEVQLPHEQHEMSAISEWSEEPSVMANYEYHTYYSNKQPRKFAIPRLRKSLPAPEGETNSLLVFSSSPLRGEMQGYSTPKRFSLGDMPQIPPPTIEKQDESPGTYTLDISWSDISSPMMFRSFTSESPTLSRKKRPSTGLHHSHIVWNVESLLKKSRTHSLEGQKSSGQVSDEGNRRHSVDVLPSAPTVHQAGTVVDENVADETHSSASTWTAYRGDDATDNNRRRAPKRKSGRHTIGLLSSLPTVAEEESPSIDSKFKVSKTVPDSDNSRRHSIDTARTEADGPRSFTPINKTSTKHSHTDKVPETELPGANSSEVDSPETKSPETQSPEAKSPEAKSPEAKSPEARSLDSKSREAKSLEGYPLKAKSVNFKSPQVRSLEAGYLEIKSLETKSLEAKSPEAKSPEVASPEARSLEAGYLEIKSLETKSLEAKSPEAKSPEVASPEARSLEAGYLEIKSLETKSLETKSPEAKSPETKSPETDSPESKSLDSKSPDSKSPRKQWPVAKSPDTTKPDATYTQPPGMKPSPITTMSTIPALTIESKQPDYSPANFASASPGRNCPEVKSPTTNLGGSGKSPSPRQPLGALSPNSPAPTSAQAFQSPSKKRKSGNDDVKNLSALDFSSSPLGKLLEPASKRRRVLRSSSSKADDAETQEPAPQETAPVTSNERIKSLRKRKAQVAPESEPIRAPTRRSSRLPTLTAASTATSSTLGDAPKSRRPPVKRRKVVDKAAEALDAETKANTVLNKQGSVPVGETIKRLVCRAEVSGMSPLQACSSASVDGKGKGVTWPEEGHLTQVQEFSSDEEPSAAVLTCTRTRGISAAAAGARPAAPKKCGTRRRAAAGPAAACGQGTNTNDSDDELSLPGPEGKEEQESQQQFKLKRAAAVVKTARTSGLPKATARKATVAAAGSSLKRAGGKKAPKKAATPASLAAAPRRRGRSAAK